MKSQLGKSKYFTKEFKLWRLENWYKIRDKKKRLVNLKFNQVDLQLINAIKTDWEAGNPIRLYTLKFRQGGVSTFFLLWFLDEAIFTPNSLSGVLADNRESLGYLWEVVRLAHATMPNSLQPKLGDDSKTSLSFPDRHSKMFVSLKIKATAIHNLLISEFCFTNKEAVRETLSAASPGANIILESVASGAGDFGHDIWLDAKKGQNEYKPLFLPWYIQEEYKLPLNGIQSVEKTQEENNLIDLADRAYGIKLNDEQILFRRYEKKRLGEMFYRNMAEDDSSCFLSTGNMYFNQRKVIRLIEELKESETAANPWMKGEDFIAWEKPQKGCVYAAGADTAEGIGEDYSVLSIFNVTKRRQAFRFKAHIGVDAFYKICDKWCREYHRCLLAVERNNHGHAVILGLIENCHYPNLYRQKSIQLSKQNAKYGWDTNTISKTLMLDQFRFGVEGDSQEDENNFLPEFEVFDLELLNELLTFQSVDGKLEAASGKHDDCIIAWSIAFQMYLTERKKLFTSDSMGVIIGKKLESAP